MSTVHAITGGLATPSNEDHRADSFKKYRKTFADLHKWMDEPWEILGTQHRLYRHDPYTTPQEAKKLFGEYADHACLDHILLDLRESPQRFSTLSRQYPRRGKPAGICPRCGSTLVWRRAQLKPELYRGCTNYSGGCRYQERSYRFTPTSSQDNELKNVIGGNDSSCVYICKKCRRLHSLAEFQRDKFCRNCGELLSVTTPPPRFESPEVMRTMPPQGTYKEPPHKIHTLEFNVESILQKITAREKFRDVSFFRHDEPPRQPCFGKRDLDLTDEIKSSLERQKLTLQRLYIHQSEAIGNILDGRSVVLPTSTASGKTLCFNIPVLDSIIRNSKSCAFYIYPTRALAQDQIRKIAAFRDNYPHEEQLYTSGSYFTMTVGGKKIVFGKYEGPTSTNDRARIREFCNIVLTNPDMLHFGILNWNWKWTEFLKNLKYVVLDEIHVYRGVFGSNVSLVLRRLRKICDSVGSDPRFILCSATIPNALEHATRLTGCKDFVLVDNDGSPHKRKTLLLWNPPLRTDGGTRQRIEPLTNIVDLLTEVLATDSKLFRTIVFGRSRSSVKNAYRLAQLRLKQYGKERLFRLIREYTATLLPEKREEIFAELASEKICAIIGTNALELGVDIPDMNCYLSIGYPGTMTSVLQQFGRVGRTIDGLGVIVLQDEPLEQYFARNPREFFNREPEEVRINPSNFELLWRHMACCVHEFDRHGGLKDDDIEEFFGSEADACKRQLVEEGIIRGITQDGKLCWKFNYSRRNPQEMYLPIRNPLSKDNFTIKCKGRKVGVMDSASILRDLHPGAIWTDQDKQFEVTEVMFDKHEVNVVEVDVDYYTFSAPRDTVSVLEEYEQKKIGMAKVSFGKVEVERQVLKYSKVVPGRDDKKKTEWETIQWGKTVPSRFRTESIWLTLSKESEDKMNNDKCFEGSLHAIEHALSAMVPKRINSDPNDISGVSEISCAATKGKPTIFIYDSFPGGVGIARACFEKFEYIISDCLKLIESCKCNEPDGCPSCIQTSKCERRNKTLDKNGAVSILRKLLDQKTVDTQA